MSCFVLFLSETLVHVNKIEEFRYLKTGHPYRTKNFSLGTTLRFLKPRRFQHPRLILLGSPGYQVPPLHYFHQKNKLFITYTSFGITLRDYMHLLSLVIFNKSNSESLFRHIVLLRPTYAYLMFGYDSTITHLWI